MNSATKVTLVWATLVVVTGAGSGFSWNTLLSCALSIAVLVLVTRASQAVSWRIVWILFLIYFGVGWINTLDEAVLFQVLPVKVAFESLAVGATTTFTVAVLLGLSLNRMKSGAGAARADVALKHSTGGWVWRALAGACVYFALYAVAGAAVHPFIKAFYEGRRLPSLSELFVIQFFRGLLYIAVVFPFIRSIVVRRWQAALVLGLCFSILGGLAPLLLSNQYMPGPIRIAHSFEVGLSNFVFGVFLGYLFTPRYCAHEVSL